MDPNLGNSYPALQMMYTSLVFKQVLINQSSQKSSLRPDLESAQRNRWRLLHHLKQLQIDSPAIIISKEVVFIRQQWIV